MTPAIGSATKKTMRRLMIDRAVQDSAFYQYAVDNGVIHIKEKG